MINPPNWPILAIDDLCSRVTSGGTPSRARSDYYVGGAIPWIKTGELNDGFIRGSEENITDLAVQESAAKILPSKTILMAMYGATVGALGTLSHPAACNQASCAMVTDRSKCHFRWLFYALLNDRPRIVSLATGAAQQNLSGTVIKRFGYATPSLAEQIAIAEVLGALDDKIAANATLVATADELAATSYQESMAGQAESRSLSSLAKFVNGMAFTKDATGTGRVVIRIAELNSGLGGSTVYNDIEVADQHLARPGDLLFAWSGSLTVHRWNRPEAIVNQHIFKVIPTGVPLWVVNAALREKLADFKGIAADKATTMGHIQRRHLDEPVRIPTAEGFARYGGLMTALWDRALQAEQESLTLAKLRDTLLPELMSGRLRVKDAEKAVGEVV